MSIRTILQNGTIGLLALIFIVAGISHFLGMSKFFVTIVPKALPAPQLIVQITGVLEILGGVGLLIPATRTVTGICLIVFLIAVFPANIEAARMHLPYSNPLWLRGLAQVVLIGLVAWAAVIKR